MTQQSSSGQQRPAASGMSQEGQGTATGAAREVTDQVKQTAGQVTHQAQQAAGQVAGQAREQVASRLADQKDRAAEGLSGVARALRQTGQQLRDQDQQGVTGYIDRAASQVERISGYLQNSDLGRLVDDVEGFARRQPAMFLGGALVLGLLGARFLKSSRPYTGTTGGYAAGASMAQRRPGYYTSYPSQVSGTSSYGSGMTSGAYSGDRTTSERASPYSTGARSYDQRREE